MYTAHFGLAADPFSLSPDPAFLYQSPAHAEALAGLRLALESRRGLTTLVGEVGTGKTTLLYALLRDAEPAIRAAYLANTKLGFLELLRQALADWGAPCERGGRLAVLDALHTFLRRCDADGAVAALVIDEAQNLDADTFEQLRLLTNFETYSHKLLQIVLVGQPELAATLRRPELRQINERVAYRCRLAPLTAAEARRYLAHRLARAGGAPALLTPAARALLVAAARGVPRRLNVLGHTAFLFAYARGASPVATRDVWAAWRAGRRDGVAGVLPQSTWRRAAWATGVGVVAAAGVAAALGGFAVPAPRPAGAPASAPAAAAAAGPAMAGVAGAIPSAPDGGTSAAPVAPAAAARRPPAAERVVVVAKGQTLSSIARRFYGSAGPQALRRLRAANPGLRDGDRLTAGDTLRVPPRASAQGGQG
jgi:general secretion pathway protein A